MTEESIAAATQRVRALLAERWPALFDEKKPVPLAIDINDALLAALPDVAADQLRRVLAKWCNRPHYLAALAAGADRHGPDGPQGTVTEERAAAAAEQLKTLQDLFRARAKAKRKAEKAMRAAAKKKAEEKKQAEEAAAAKQAKQAEPPPPPPKPAPAAAKPAGPVIIVKKRRSAQPGPDA